MKKTAAENKPVAIRASNIVEKQNILNEMQSNFMTLQEVRFFSIYLSKINARDQSTRVVRFPLTDFAAILDIQKVNIQKVKETTNKLLSKVVNIPDSRGGYIGFQLFKECKVYTDITDKRWYVEIDAHDRALPLMFDFKQKYFSYRVDNVLQLLSTNQIRMYETLKQYERAGEMRISVKGLKDQIGVSNSHYPRFGDFKIKVLDSCQKALEEKTDICYAYELIKKGRGGKVAEILFTISANRKAVNLMSVENYIDAKKTMVGLYEIDEDEHTVEEESEGDQIDYDFLGEAFDNEFTVEEVRYLYSLALPVVKRDGEQKDFILRMYDYLKMKNDLLNTKMGVKHRYGYIKKLIELDNE